MRNSLIIAAAMVAMLCMVGTVLATVSIDQDGYGFVGKGDVQIAFGWNNAQLQTNLPGVTFTYKSTDTYDVTQVWATGNEDNPVSLSAHQEVVTTTAGVAADLQSSGRMKNGQQQWTGFDLNGFTSVVTTGTVPEPDYIDYVTYTWTDKKGVEHTTDGMPVDENGDLYTEGYKKAIQSITLTSSVSALYANFGGYSVQIWPLPV